MDAKQRQAWRENWPAYPGSTPPENDYLTGSRETFKERLLHFMGEGEATTMAIIVCELMFEVADESEDVDRFLEVMIQKVHE